MLSIPITWRRRHAVTIDRGNNDVNHPMTVYPVCPTIIYIVVNVRPRLYSVETVHETWSYVIISLTDMRPKTAHSTST